MAMDKKKAAAKAVERPVSNEEKRKALEAAISQIEKHYGEGSVMFMGQNKKMNVEHVSTGSLMLDMALGIGGLPRGRIIEVYGAESSGKTTLCLHAVAEVQKTGGMAAFIDVEHALDPVYAKALGVDIDNLLVSQPDTGEQALEIIDMLVRSGALDIVVLDSVAAMASQAEIDGEMGEAHVGVQARLMSQAMRKLTSSISKTNCVAIFINQIREKIGILYGNPETTPGGRALKFYASVRIDVRKGEPLKDGADVIGNRIKCKVVKNKVAPPFKTAEFDMIFGEGISKLGEIVDCAVELDIIKKSGSWFSYQDMKIGQGKDKVKDFLKENPTVCSEIENKIREEFAMKPQELDKVLEGTESTENAANESETQSEVPTENVKEEKPKKTKSKKSEKPNASESDTDDDFTEFNPEELE